MREQVDMSRRSGSAVIVAALIFGSGGVRTMVPHWLESGGDAEEVLQRVG
jgi:hypothetical protein